MPDLVVMHPGDDVWVALREIAAAELVTAAGQKPLQARTAVPRGHKMACRDLPAGSLVHKYGQVIGAATQDIAAGAQVHTHNLAVPGRGTRVQQDTHPLAAPEPSRPRTFWGYRRPDGRVGTRHDIGILTTVSCSATVAEQIARRSQQRELPGVDAVVALTHGSGCGLETSGPGWENLRRSLSGYATHPNIAGLVVIGLGCEMLTLETFLDDLGASQVPVRGFTIQDQGGTRASIDHGLELVAELAGQVRAQREECGLSELVLGLKCGGSDAWSGVTANPVLGYASDVLVGAGGTSILAEVPELYGAEHLLAARAVSPEVAQALLAKIDWWEQYTAAHGATLDANPSAGNKAGGITTIVEKSLGAVAKAGTAPVQAVLDYGQRAPRHGGLVVMDTPGYDPVAVTGQVAGGATVEVFTTGRGSVFGSLPTPCLKLATTSELARRMSDDIDLDCGPVLDGTSTIAEMGEQLLDLICATASGQPTRSEELGLGHLEIIPWQIGAVM